jgi:hypothetical protein
MGTEEEFVSKFLSLIRDHFLEKSKGRTKNALSAVQTLDELRHVVGRNGTAEATVETRSPDWLEQNGYCLDHIFVKESTLPFAGKGAFARRFLPKDSLIIASPAIATRRGQMSVNVTFRGKETNEIQLMTNYHFGHKNSRALFFPLTQAIAMNHNSARSWSGKEPNARLQFSTTDKRSIYFENLPLEDLFKVRNDSVDLIC